MGVAVAAVFLMIFLLKTLLWNVVIFIAVFGVVNLGLYKLLEKRFPKMLERIE